MNYIQKKRVILAIIITLHILLFAFLFNTMEKTHASRYINGERIVIGVNYFPPRVQQICHDNFIGVDWNIARTHEKRCRILWTSWAGEIKNSNSASQY